MRRFTDSQGQEWEAVVGKGSFGMLVLLFHCCSGRGSDVRQIQIAEENRISAERHLADLSEADLRDRLDDAEAWQAADWPGLPPSGT